MPGAGLTTPLGPIGPGLRLLPLPPFSSYPAATLLLQLPQGRDVALGQIHDVDVIPDACRGGGGWVLGSVQSLPRLSLPPGSHSWLLLVLGSPVPSSVS